MDNQSQAPPPSTAPEAAPSQQAQNAVDPSQPQPSMMQPQPLGGIAVPSGGNANKGLIIKCVIIILAILAMALPLAAIDKATYYQSVCKKYNEKSADRGPGGDYDRRNPGGGQGPQVVVNQPNCEESTPLSYDQCKYFENLFDELFKGAVVKGSNVQPKVPACPSKWLVEPQAYMLAITWVSGAIVLIGTTVASQQQSRDPQRFNKIDSLVLFVAAGMSLLCGLCMMIFFIWLVSSDFWCGHDGQGYKGVFCNPKFAWGAGAQDNYGYSCYRFGIDSSAFSGRESALGRSKVRGYTEKQSLLVQKDCSSFNTEVYQPYLVLVGAIFAIVTGIVAIVGAIILKKSAPSQGIAMGAGGQYNSLGLQNNNMGMMGNKSMGPYQQTSQMQMAGGSQYPQPLQQYGYGNQPQNMQMMGQQQQQYGQPTPSWQAMQAQAAQQYRAGRGGPR